jgi:hypothetical protein
MYCHRKVTLQLVVILYPPFSTMTSSRYPDSTIVNYHNAVAEDIPFICQKIERNQA